MPDMVAAGIALLAKMAVVGLIEEEWAAAIATGGGDIVERVIAKVPRAQRDDLHRRIRAIEEQLPKLPTFPALEPADQQRLVTTAVILLQSTPATPTSIVADAYDPADMAMRTLATGDAIVRSRLDAKEFDRERTALGELLAILHRHQVDRPETLSATEREFRMAVLGAFAELAEIIERRADAERKAQSAALLTAMFRPAAPYRFVKAQYPDGTLLSADFEAVPLLHRDAEMADILAWCGDERQVAIRLYKADGGAGKTRLLREALRRLRGLGWTAGFVNTESGVRLVNTHWTLLQEAQRPAILVLDYADIGEETQKQLAAVLDFAALQHGNADGQKLRLVLIVRNRAPDWFKSLMDGTNDAGRGLLSGPATMDRDMPPLAVPERQDLFLRARESFARHLDRTPAPCQVPDLGADHFAGPLYVLIAALQSLDVLQGGSVDISQLAQMEWVLARHRAMWRRELGHTHLVEAAAQTLAFVCLFRGLRQKQQFELLRGHVPKLKRLSATEQDRICALLHRLYPGTAYLNPLVPDPLGNELTRSQFDADPDMIPAMDVLGVSFP